MKNNTACVSECCSCSGSVTDRKNTYNFDKKSALQILAGLLLFVCAIFLPLNEPYKSILYMTAYLTAGWNVILSAIKHMFKKQLFDETFLMSIATIGAVCIGEYPEAAAVMLLYQIGEFFQEIAVNRSKRMISKLMDINPDYANIKLNGKIVVSDPKDVKIGDIIIVKPGEKIPLDGRVMSGASSLNVSALTGESIPRDVTAENEVLSGSVNLNGVLEIEITKEYKDSTASKIIELVENAADKKSKTENFITRFARYYTPAVVAAAIVLAFIVPLFIDGMPFLQWINRALIFLVISCPCALVISVPLSYFSGIGKASQNGILIKGSNYLNALCKVDTMVFDKTGTLTEGKFKIVKIAPANGISTEELLKLSAYVESYSNHPIAKSITEEYNQKIEHDTINNYVEFSGFGVTAEIEGVKVAAGNSKLMEQTGIQNLTQNEAGTYVHVAVNNKYAGYILIADEIKESSARAISTMKKLGITRMVMLTGDEDNVAQNVAKKIGITDVFSKLLPHDKVRILESILQDNSKGKTAFVGDGINDAPVLARADIGIAMGGVGSDAAIEAADIVLMRDDIQKLPLSLIIARKTHNIVIQNIAFALGVKAIILILGALGIANMWLAVFADVGVSIIAVLNAVRILKFNTKE